MNIEKIEIRPGQWVWVDKENKPKSGDYSLYSRRKIHKCVEDIIGDEFFKIVAASPDLNLEGVPNYVDYSAEQDFEMELGDGPTSNPSINSMLLKNYKQGAQFGYETAKKELFTEEDMRKAILKARIRDKENPPHPKYSIESIIEQIKSEKK